MFADIRHALRTPLTVIRGEAEVTLRGRECKGREYRGALQRIVETTAQLNKLVEDMLQLARSEAASLHSEPSEILADRLVVRRRRGRKRATGTRAPITISQAVNQRWSLDFAADVLSWGRRFRVLAIVDDCTREALALVVDSSIGGRRVVRKLDAVSARRGRPAMIVSDNGTELT